MARLILELSSEVLVVAQNFDKHYFQSLLYSRLQDAGLSEIHQGTKFRFFTFSDFFPSGPLQPGENKKIIVSSPDSEFIEALKVEFKRQSEVYLGESTLHVSDARVLNFSSSPLAFITGSPVVLYKDNKRNIYFSMRRGDSLAYFMMRIKENALKRYRQYSGDYEFDLPHPIFDNVTFNREVAVEVSKGSGKFIVIGSAWYRLERFIRRRKEEQFYRFLMDAGLGEKPSLGFGFLNPLGRGSSA